MEIIIEDIPAGGLDIEANSAQEVWLNKAMQAALDLRFTEHDQAALALNCQRCGQDVDIRGKLQYSIHVDCDRCLKPLCVQAELDINLHLTPLYENDRQYRKHGHEEEELITEDEGFNYYEGDRFELDGIIAELVVINQTMKNICSQDCKGLCQSCGQNLNEGTCNCEQEKTNSRWDALKNFKSNK